MTPVSNRGYVLRAPRSFGQAAMAVVFGVLFLGAYLVVRPSLGWGNGSLMMVLFGVASVGFGVMRGLKRSEVLGVDDDGVRFGGVAVPWASVWQLVLLRPDPVAGAFRADLPPQVGLRLKRGAPLPSGMTSLVTDPNDPLSIDSQLRSDVVKPEIDGEALLAAAAACAPPDVVLVERVGDQEHVRQR